MKSHIITTLLLTFFVGTVVLFPFHIGYFLVVAAAATLIGVVYWLAYQCVDGLFKK